MVKRKKVYKKKVDAKVYKKKVDAGDKIFGTVLLVIFTIIVITWFIGCVV